MRAIDLLDRQKHVEGSEEEILYTHYELLLANHAANAADFLERARAGLDRKLKLLTRPQWRSSFCESILLHAKILSPVPPDP